MASRRGHDVLLYAAGVASSAAVGIMPRLAARWGRPLGEVVHGMSVRAAA